MRSMLAHTLEVIRGLTPTSGYQLQFVADHDATEIATITNNYIPAGRCVSLNSAGNTKLGVGTQDVAMWTFWDSDAYDVATDGGTLSSDPMAYSQGTPTGGNKCVVALGGFELETTEFIDSNTYAVMDKLTAAAGTAGNASQMWNTAGKLDNASVKCYSYNVVGIVTKGFTPNVTAKNAHGFNALRFWPIYLPKITGITEPTWG